MSAGTNCGEPSPRGCPPPARHLFTRGSVLPHSKPCASRSDPYAVSARSLSTARRLGSASWCALERARGVARFRGLQLQSLSSETLKISLRTVRLLHIRLDKSCHEPQAQVPSLRTPATRTAQSLRADLLHERPRRLASKLALAPIPSALAEGQAPARRARQTRGPTSPAPASEPPSQIAALIFARRTTSRRRRPSPSRAWESPGRTRP